VHTTSGVIVRLYMHRYSRLNRDAVCTKVGDACVSDRGEELGRCVVRELDDVKGGTLKRTFADVALVRFKDNVLVENCVDITDSTNTRRTYK